MSENRPHAQPRPHPIKLPQRVIFLHIVKTAGTSLSHFFKMRLPKRRFCSHGDFLSWPDDKSERLAQLKRYRFVSGHFGYDLAAPLMADSYSFTFLRDPVDRVLSFYKFCLLEDMQKQFLAARIASEKGLDGFLNSREPEIVEMLDNQQTWQLANTYWYKDRQDMRHVSDTELLDMASSHLQQFSRVGLKETYDEDFRCILDDLAIKEELPVFKHHVTPDPVLRDSLKASTLETLRNRVELDEELYRKIVAERESFVSE